MYIPIESYDIIPIDQSGNGILDLGHTDNMLRWSGNKPHPITFDLNRELLVERIEVACEFWQRQASGSGRPQAAAPKAVSF